MVFNPNIPNAGDFLAVSQIDIFRNNNSISTQYQRDHVPLEDGAPDEDVIDKRGHHNTVSFSEQTVDPTTTANTYAVYTKNNAGAPEIYGRGESDATVYKWTKAGALAPSLRLEAYVLFDREGNIIKDKADNELQFNVTSITPQSIFNGKAIRDDWVVVFKNNITTANYFWYISAFYGNQGGPNADLSKFVSTVPYMFGAYTDAVKNSQIRIMTKNINTLSTAADNLVTKTIQLQVFTVA